MKELNGRNRHRLKHKKSKKLVKHLKDRYGLEEQFSDLELGTSEGMEVVITKNTIIAFTPEDGDETFITLRGILLLKPTRSYVTVDMGAVKFVYNGADVMAPGIVDADPEIQEGDAVWVRDEKNLKPLAVGKALMDGKAMKSGTSGKALKTIHYISDEIWNVEL